MKKLFALITFLLFSFSTFAQTEQPEMADAMRSNGKIYVVVVVCLVILLGLVAYVVHVDRKISRIENKD
jgi:uncharacterized membrane protein YcjF (UPF0283 family)